MMRQPSTAAESAKLSQPSLGQDQEKVAQYEPFVQSFLFKLLICFAVLIVVYSGFMALLDPYTLVGGNDISNKKLPYFPLYQYNYIKRLKRVDYGFLGSSAVNYIPVDRFYPAGTRRFSMGIESSNIYEHIAYGKVLAARKPKEITLFVTFYALNPTRGNQKYFNPVMLALDNPVSDFIIQYFNKPAFVEALNYWQRSRTHETLQQEFRRDGSRTQNYYKFDPKYNFDDTLADYLAWLYLDPRYYASEVFKKPESLQKGIQAIRGFKSYLEDRGIRLRLVSCPEERNSLVLIYHSGLGNTYEAYRQALAGIQPFYDLNLDTALTSTPGNYWDTHHPRNGERVVQDLKSGRYLIDSRAVAETLPRIRPSKVEMRHLESILNHYPRWEKVRKTLGDDLKSNPAKK